MDKFGILSLILSVVIYVWLMVLAYGAHTELMGGWKTYAMVTYIVGSLASLGLVGSIIYTNEK